jgi:hypothetical protein
MFTVEVVFPTPPFWFATTNTLVAPGRGMWGRFWALCLASTLCCASRANGVAWSS